MRRLAAVATLLLAASLLAGCGGSAGETRPGKAGSPSPRAATGPPSAATRNCAAGSKGFEELRAVGVGCPEARLVAAAWTRRRACDPHGLSRRGCSIGSYRCSVVVTDRGLAGGCSRPHRSISFIARRGR